MVRRTAAMICLMVATAQALGEPVYKDRSATAAARAADLVARLTLVEKIDLLGGTGFTTKPVPRLGIPPLVMSDGPIGVRNYGPSTAYPAGLAMACSWDVDTARAIGVALGRDARARGVHILLGPAMNLYRSPLCGRNFEYLGEDPLLAGKLAAAYVEGLQSQHVSATIKHFAGNEQEFDRYNLDSVIDERTLRELYLKPFEICVEEAHPGCVMTSYNPLNGVHASENRWLIHDVLKTEWQFPGVVMSDWDSCHDTLGICNAGLDLEMPTGKFFNREKLLPLVQSGKVTEATIDDKVRRLFTLAIAMGWLDHLQKNPEIALDDPANDKTALAGARQSLVLLTNGLPDATALLPLERKRTKHVFVLGPTADPAVVCGGGSANDQPFHAISVLQGLKAAAGSGVEIVRVPWKGKSTRKKGPARDDLAEPTVELIPAAMQDSLRQADAAVVCVGFNDKTGTGKYEGEGSDRSYSLPQQQVDLINAVTKLTPRTVVVVTAGGAVETATWLKGNGPPAALIFTAYPGQNGGQAVAEAIFGDINPSGKLAFTWETSRRNQPAFANFPSAETGRVNTYKEGVFLGYRADHTKTPPLFAFGTGLSYTHFSVGKIAVASSPGGVALTAPVRNTGERSGAAVVQCYILPPPAELPRPARELKAFCKIMLQPGETRDVTLSVPRASLAWWNPKTKSWTVTPGAYRAEVSLGADGVQQAPFTVAEEKR